MNKRRSALLHSVISLLLCVSMLVGTTFAWFTDSVNSGTNVITAGNLDVQMFWTEDLSAVQWHDAENPDNVPFDYDNWEPGYTQVRYVKIVNAGNLALKYSLTLAPVSNVGTLAEVIGVYCAENVTENIVGRDLTGMEYLGLLKDTMHGGEAAYGELLPGGETVVAVAMQMDTAAGNTYQNQTAGDFVFRLMATQMANESDSFDSSYDADAGMMGSVIHYSVSEDIVDKTENGALKEAVTVGVDSAAIYAQAPSGVKLAEGIATLSLSVDTMTTSEANVELKDGEVSTSLDIHMEGIAEDNSVPMLITLKGLMKKGLNSTSVAMYHVENGETIEMKLVSNPANHNEFSYDPATGDVVLAVASFSEYVAVVDNKNLWEGTAKTDWYNDTDTEFTLTTAEQIAGFGVLVDGGNSFEGKTIRLGNNIDLGGAISFNPIGCGYDKDTGVNNSNGVTGAAFKGIFDGQGYTISNMYQNGWELGLSYCNLGGGLFASIANGTVKDLTISGANIVMECVEMGVLVGLSQGNCTYKNITIKDSKIANYQRATGGLIGEISPVNGGETTTIKNVTIGSDVVVGSLWGDFDCPVGGVIGARWDDGNTTEVEMENVTVACCLDVYNDVTSSYQWYAYRRAGMLIGNTDTPPADGKNAKTATADFLTCTDVVVKYGPWVNYHYCEFNNYNSSWPWVRVEAGENCEACSNPRYGVPTFNGVKVTEDTTKHTHADGDECNVSIPFGQLYGGGQGVFGGGQTEDYTSTHKGVTIEMYDYTVTYMDRGEIFAVDYVENDTAYTVKHTAYVPTRTETTFKEWVNAGGTKVDTIAAGNTTDYVLYDSWHGVYTARFLDQQGKVIYEEEFNTSQTTLNEPDVPAVDGLVVVGWEDYDLQNAKGDIAIRPVYKINDYVQLNPVDTDNDGVTNYYQVVGSTIPSESTDIIIPEEVNGIKVTEITTGAFADGRLRDVFVPHSIEMLGANAFCKNADGGILGIGAEYPQIQIIFDGTKAEWDALVAASEAAGNDWDDNIGANSNIVCLRETNAGYYNMKPKNWLQQNPPSGWEWKSGSYPDWFTDRYKDKYPHLFETA